MTMKVKPKEPRKPEAVPVQRRVKAQHLKYDQDGELMDPTPMAPPIGYKKSPSITEQIRSMIRGERLRQEAEAEGYESFEEADDFEIGDDFDPTSPYEEVFEPMPQDDGGGRLKELGDYIGERIIGALGGEAASPPPGPEPAPPADKTHQPPGSGRREAKNPTFRPGAFPNPSPPRDPEKS